MHEAALDRNHTSLAPDGSLVPHVRVGVESRLGTAVRSNEHRA